MALKKERPVGKMPTRKEEEELRNKHFRHDAAVQTIRKAAEKWPTSFLARSQAPTFTGGLISVGYLANLDSAGLGPDGSFRVGRQICYDVGRFCAWLVDRIEV